MATINYAIEITTDETAVTDADYGISSGVFRFITGRPGYDGSPTYPTGEAGIGNDVLQATWYENFLDMSNFSAPNRYIDVIQSGNYGTLSGFKFSVLQSQGSQQFDEFLTDYSIHLVNRRVQLYVVINDVFYYGWGGAVKKTEHIEEAFTIDCQDLFRSLHKMMPPRINTATLSDPEDQDSGDPIPVTAGDVQYTKIANTTGDPTWITLAEDAMGNPLKAVPCLSGTIIAEGSTRAWNANVNLITTNKRFDADYFNGMHLFAVYGDEVPDTSVGFKINDSWATAGGSPGTGSYTNLYQTTVFTDDNWGVRSSVDAGSNYKDIFYEYTPANPTTEVPDTKWFWKIADLSQTYAVSDSGILSYLGSSEGQIKIYTYSEDEKKYIDISELVEAVDTTNSTITLTSVRNISNEGDIQVARSVPVSLESFQVDYDYAGNFDSSGDLYIYNPLAVPTSDWWVPLLDRDRTTYARCDFAQALRGPVQWKARVTMPGDFDYGQFNSLYIGFDFELEATTGATAADWFGIEMIVEATDVFGRRFENLSFERVWPSIDEDFLSSQQKRCEPGRPLNFIPNSYYDQGGNANDERSMFLGYGSLVPDEDATTADKWKYLTGGYIQGGLNRNFLELPSDILDAYKDGLATSIDVKFRFHPLYTDGSGITSGDYIKFKQFAVWGLKNVSLVGDELYTPVSGQIVDPGGDDVPSNTVYGTYRLILEDLDGIAAADIDYGNLLAERGNWHVGRQFTERKNSQVYLTELCKQSFVALFPTRAGKRGLSAWIDDTTVAATHDTSTILRDSIKKVKLTPVEKMFTDYYIEYNWDPGLEKYTRALYVTKANESSFPALDGNWEEYAGGLNDMYADAKDLWEIVRGAYEIASAITPDMPKDLTQLSYYIDTSTLEGNPYPQYNGTNGSAMKYLRQLVYWTARQKVVVEYSLPLTTTNIQLELMDYISFTDDVLTSGTEFNGWITKISLDLKNNKIDVQATLLPLDYYDTQTNIIFERGTTLNSDTITERGTTLNTDTYTETGV